MNEMMMVGGVSMSSREIAGLVNIRHDNVKRVIDRLVDKGVIASPQVEEKPTEGRPAAEYIFTGVRGRRDSIIVVAQLSPEFTAKLVDRWDELEKSAALLPSTPDFSDPVAMARAWADAKEAEQLATHSLAIAAPKVQAFERIADSSGSMTIREAAKDLGLPPGVFGDWLKANRWIYKQGKTNLAFETRINSGFMEHKVTVLELEDEDGTPRTKSVSQPRITPKGLAKLAIEVPGARS